MQQMNLDQKWSWKKEVIPWVHKTRFIISVVKTITSAFTEYGGGWNGIIRRVGCKGRIP